MFFIDNRNMKKAEFNLADTRWVDLTGPTKEDLVKIGEELKIPQRILSNALDPEHLPKYESINSTAIIFLRIIDPHKKPNAANIQELTTKVTMIIQDKLVVTIHRLDPDFLIDFRSLFLTDEGQKFSQQDLIKKIVTSSILTFDEPINILEKNIIDFEDKIFKFNKHKTILRDGYYLKRKASAYRKVLKFSLNILDSLNSNPDFIWKDFQAVRENAERFLFYTEDDLENVTGLLNLHISLSAQKTNEASYKTNEVMRVLTVFSIFFLPLNFLTGLYGMNFEFMPELKHPQGYITVLVVMGIISTAIFYWIHKRGWLKNPEDQGYNS